MNFEVVTQAHHWMGAAHLCVVATPQVRGRRDEPIRKFLKTTGAGWLVVHLSECEMAVPPRFDRKLNKNRDPLSKWLHESQRNTETAGKSHCWRSTPFSRTLQEFECIVERNPGITMKDCMNRMAGKHHYSSDSAARNTLSQWLRKGVIKGVRWEKKGRDIILFLSGERLGTLDLSAKAD